MRTGLLPLVLVGVFAHVVAIAQSPGPDSLAAATQRQNAARDVLAAEAADSQAVLQKWYHSALDALKKDVTGKGDLDGVLAIEAERGRMERDLTAEEKEKLSKLLRSVRDQYDQARAQRVADYKTKIAATLRTYQATLETLEKSLTQKSDIEGAIAVRKERAAIGEQLNALQAGATGAPPVAPATAAASSVPPKAASAVGKLSTASVAPAKPVKIEVAEIMKAYDAIQKLTPEGIPFATPKGPAENRGRGVLLKNDPMAGRRGTTWTFGLMRAPTHAGVLIIHPLGEGQIVVHLRDDGISLISPDEVAKTPWTGGDPKGVRMTNDADKLFPLQAQNYRVVSQLSGSGKYTISINGKVIGRASLEAGPALVLTSEFAGERLPAGVEFPLSWGPGYSAIVTAWPGKGGLLNCRGVIFQIGASLPAPE